MPKRAALILLVAAFLAGGLAITSSGGPYRPLSQLDDQVRSLAGVSRLRVRVVPVPGGIADLGVNRDDVQASMKQRLQEAGFEIMADEQEDQLSAQLPRLTLRILGGTDPEVPGSICFAVALEFEQEATIDRLDEKMVLPTYTRKALGLVRKGRFPQSVRTMIDDLVDSFVKRHEQATRAR